MGSRTRKPITTARRACSLTAAPTGCIAPGRVYDSDGTTLLNTVTASNTTITAGGIAFHGTGFTSYIDTVVKSSVGPLNDDWYAITVDSTDNPLNFEFNIPSADFGTG